jgi:hypothetical protein
VHGVDCFEPGAFGYNHGLRVDSVNAALGLLWDDGLCGELLFLDDFLVDNDIFQLQFGLLLGRLQAFLRFVQIVYSKFLL